MSNIRSFSPTPPQPVHVRRHSQSGILPLPASLTTPTTPRPTPGSTVSNGNSGPSSSPSMHAQQTRIPSALSIRPPGDLAPPSPSTSPFSLSHTNYHASATHAGGIQPSASFFRPSRPHQYSPPSTGSSTTELPPIASSDQEAINLTPLTKRVSNASDEHANPGVAQLSPFADDEHFTKPKQIQDALLPLHQAHKREHSTLIAANHNSAGRLVRNSVDLLINLSKRLSTESRRQSSNSRMPVEERMTFERKIMDEESGGGMLHAVSLNPTDGRSSSERWQSPTPDFYTFIPTRYESSPPLFAVPIIDAKTNKPKRRHQFFQSRNRFFFGGRLLTGGDAPWAFLASLTMIFTITGTWFGTTCVWWWHNESIVVAIVGIYMTLLVITNMLATVCLQFSPAPSGNCGLPFSSSLFIPAGMHRSWHLTAWFGSWPAIS